MNVDARTDEGREIIASLVTDADVFITGNIGTTNQALGLDYESMRAVKADLVYCQVTGFGARGPIITAMASELFPGRQFGRIYGALSLGNGIGGALGPWLGGAIYDVTGSYRVAFLLASGFCVMGAACFWVAARSPVRRTPS